MKQNSKNRTRRRRGGSVWSPFNLVRKYREYSKDKREGNSPGHTRRERKMYNKIDSNKALRKQNSDRVLQELEEADNASYFKDQKKIREKIKNSPHTTSNERQTKEYKDAKYARDLDRNALAYRDLEKTVKPKSWYNPF
jgi:hypothetical protein